ncbi:MAG TPA: ribosome biogenesis factor YjgA [Steroidobacteraceae bacterium]|nr:ribosome biogenesis factor YjgA [Steroidobacteraceae bacterium]
MPEQEKHEQDGTSEAPPSKSERKRTAQAAQQLGEELIELADAELEALGLPEPLSDAIRAARGIASRAAGVRQRQYIGRLMRDIDPAEIRRALDARRARAARETRRFHLTEFWRARLIEEPREALEELARVRPRIDRQGLQRAVAAARAERAHLKGASGGASRQLLRMLRALFEAPE